MPYVRVMRALNRNAYRMNKILYDCYASSYHDLKPFAITLDVVIRLIMILNVSSMSCFTLIVQFYLYAVYGVTFAWIGRRIGHKCYTIHFMYLV